MISPREAVEVIVNIWWVASLAFSSYIDSLGLPDGRSRISLVLWFLFYVPALAWNRKKQLFTISLCAEWNVWLRPHSWYLISQAICDPCLLLSYVYVSDVLFVTTTPPWAALLISEIENLLSVSLSPQTDQSACPDSPCCPGLFTQLLISLTLLPIPDYDPTQLLLSLSLLLFLIESPEHFGSLPHLMSLIAEFYYVDDYQIFSVWEKNI